MEYDFEANIRRISRYSSIAPSIDIIQGTGNGEERQCPCGKTFAMLGTVSDKHAWKCPTVKAMMAAAKLLREGA